MSTTTQAARYSADYIDLGSDDEACSRCEGDGCSHCHGRGLVPATSDARCYACDASPVGTRDRRPEGGRVEAACVRHAEPKSPATSAPTDVMPADGHAVRIAGERRGAPILYGSRMDTRESSGLSREEAARRLGVSVTTVRRLEARGQLRVVRLGGRVVVPSSEIARLLTPSQPVAKAVRASEASHRAVMADADPEERSGQ